MGTARYMGPRGSFSLDDEDMLWAARMIVGEGGEGAKLPVIQSYLWAMANRWHLFGGSWPTFTALVRAFSQPINPIWARDGSMCRAGGKYHGTKFCDEDKLRRRERVTRMPWDDVPIHIRTAVRQFAAGQLAPPDEWASVRKGRISNWGAKWLKNKAGVPLPEREPQGLLIADEWFFEDRSLRAGEVRVEGGLGPLPTGPQGVSTLGALTVLLLSGAAGVGGWLLWKKLGG